MQSGTEIDITIASDCICSNHDRLGFYEEIPFRFWDSVLRGQGKTYDLQKGGVGKGGGEGGWGGVMQNFLRTSAATNLKSQLTWGQLKLSPSCPVSWMREFADNLGRYLIRVDRLEITTNFCHHRSPCSQSSETKSLR